MIIAHDNDTGIIKADDVATNANGLLSIDDLRLCAITGDEKKARRCMLDAQLSSPTIQSYSINRAWTVVNSYMREGQEQKAFMLIQCMPESFFSSRAKKAMNDALCIASNAAMRPTCSMLMRNGADPSIMDPQGMTPIMHFARMCDSQLMTQALQVINEKSLDIGENQAVKALNKRGGPSQWDAGMHLVTGAGASAQKKACLKIMIEAGLDQHKLQDFDRFNLIHMAAGMNDPQIIQTLVECGINMEIRSASGLTPLMIAAYKGNTLNAQKLCELGANPNTQRPSDGLTAAHIAASKDFPEVLHVLVTAGADLSLKTSDTEKSPLDFAKYGKAKNATLYLSDKSPGALPPVMQVMMDRVNDLLSPIKNSMKLLKNT